VWTNDKGRQFRFLQIVFATKARRTVLHGSSTSADISRSGSRGRCRRTITACHERPQPARCRPSRSPRLTWPSRSSWLR